jgi:transcription termination/antitermination protein NusG
MHEDNRSYCFSESTHMMAGDVLHQSGPSSFAWYALQVRSGRERIVVEALKDRIEQYNLGDRFGRIIVPVEHVIEMRNGRKRKTSRKFFPSYVLIEMVMEEPTWYLVRNTLDVLRFLGGYRGEKPTPLSQKEVDDILQRVQEGSTKPKPKVLFEPGEVIRITHGPFVDFNGVVEEANYEKNRLRVSVLIFGRPTVIELEFSEVTKGS